MKPVQPALIQETADNRLCPVAMLVLSACVRIDATAEDYPHLLRRPIDANAVAVGISMKLKVLFGSLSPTLYTGAYFIRLEEKEDILSGLPLNRGKSTLGCSRPE